MFHDEDEILKVIQKVLGPSSSKNKLVGIGDDAAVIPIHGKLVATIDTIVQGIHFDLKYSRYEEIGQKAISVSVSDVAAMGATPRYALVTLGTNPEGLKNLRPLYKGIARACKDYRIQVVGGNLTKSKALFLDVVVLGEVQEKPFLRQGAKVGDLIAVTGNLGSSAAGLHVLRKWGRNFPLKWKPLVTSHLTPEARVQESQIIRRFKRVTAMIDVSDGLCRDLTRLTKASRVGAILDSNRLPLSPELLSYCARYKLDARKMAYCGGEDYELLFTVSPKYWPQMSHLLKRKGVRCQTIGWITKEQGLHLYDEGDYLTCDDFGWDHFQPRDYRKGS